MFQFGKDIPDTDSLFFICAFEFSSDYTKWKMLSLNAYVGKRKENSRKITSSGD